MELDFEEPVEINEIHLTFDTGFQRELILTPSDHITKNIIRGPQPETIKSYRIYAGETWLAEDTDNYLRKRIHHLAQPVVCNRLKIEVLETHGAPEARIFEIRVY